MINILSKFLWNIVEILNRLGSIYTRLINDATIDIKYNFTRIKKTFKISTTKTRHIKMAKEIISPEKFEQMLIQQRSIKKPDGMK